MPKIAPHGAWSKGITTVPPSTEALPVAAQLRLVVATDGDGDASLRTVVHAGGGVGPHEDEPVGGLQLGMHHLVRLGSIVADVELSERGNGELAAKRELEKAEKEYADAS